MSGLPTLDPLDRRLNLFGGELAETALRGKVAAARFVDGRPAHVVAAHADLRLRPDAACSIDHQLLLGETVQVFDERAGWAWVKADFDGYVGWTLAAGLAAGMPSPTHVVSVPRTFAYPGPDLRLPAARTLSMGSAVRVVGEAETRGAPYLVLDSGEALFARHLRPRGTFDSDYVAVARKFLATPYLWGGATGCGLDCSGLIQLAMRMCGRAVLRDSDMQAATIGGEIDGGAGWRGLRRGDLIFWRGHVAIVEGDGNLLHANGYTMDVTSEPLDRAIARIGRLFERPIGCRRP
ncbi:MAG: peptidase P60 [Alphaproteobacteria bacterium]|nr:MAG: peptidase P60 [Alphaproteobacteria bacterium]